MKQLPQTDETVMLRTDFTDDAAWQAIRSEINEPPRKDQESFAMWASMYAASGQPMGELRAHVEIVDDPEYTDITLDQVLALLPPGSHYVHLFVVDRTSVSHPDHPILVVDVSNLSEERGRTFRAVPAQIQAIDDNLSISNMDWEDFADCVDESGVFRGFPEA